MTNDKAYCIRSNAFYDNRCTNTDCDRHESNANHDRQLKWANFDACEEYETNEQ